jgi:hypothetical protein
LRRQLFPKEAHGFEAVMELKMMSQMEEDKE